jgi:hypothetical protein
MKFAPIVPRGCEDLLPKTGHQICFSNYAVEDYGYCAQFRGRVEMGEFVFMDHLIYGSEAAELPTADQMLIAINRIRPTAVVVPDVPDSWIRTRASFGRWAPLLGRLTAKVGVLQGMTMPELFIAAKYYDQRAQYIFIPKKLAKNVGLSRAEIVRTLVDGGALTWYGSPRIHLLGAEYPYDDIIALRDNKWVIGTDSAQPTSLALRVCTYEDAISAEAHKLPKLVRRYPNFYDIPREELAECYQQFSANVEWMRIQCGAHSNNLVQHATPMVSQDTAIPLTE